MYSYFFVHKTQEDTYCLDSLQKRHISSLATKAHFSADTLRRDRQAKAHVPRAAGIDFARVEGGFHVLCCPCSRQAFLGRGLFACVECGYYRLSSGRKKGLVFTLKNTFMKFCCIIISLLWRKSQYVPPGCRYPRARHDTVTQKTTIRFFFSYLLLKQIHRRAGNVSIHSAFQEMLTRIYLCH